MERKAGTEIDDVDDGCVCDWCGDGGGGGIKENLSTSIPSSEWLILLLLLFVLWFKTVFEPVNNIRCNVDVVGIIVWWFLEQPLTSFDDDDIQYDDDDEDNILFFFF